ncbi:MAG: hypothetical protein PSV35_02815, partial [bacterium]|nr:hypothetical protein [bacterium]
MRDLSKNSYHTLCVLFCIILWLGWTNSILAQSPTQQTKQWTNLSLRGHFFHISPKLIYLFDAQSRYNFDPNEFEEGLIRSGLGWKSTP